jgi:hypothetical protein
VEGLHDDAELGEVGDVALHDDVVRPVGVSIETADSQW